METIVEVTVKETAKLIVILFDIVSQFRLNYSNCVGNILGDGVNSASDSSR